MMVTVVVKMLTSNIVQNVFATNKCNLCLKAGSWYIAPIIEGVSFYGRAYEFSYVLPAKIHSFTMNFKKSSNSEHLKSKWQKIEKLIQVKYTHAIL